MGTAFNREVGKCPNFQVIAPSTIDLDLKDSNQVRKIFEFYKPEIFINCAAYTDVDRAEADQEACRLVNSGSLSFVAKSAEEFNSHVIHFSTDYIFDGHATRPYLETSLPNPINFYGETKLKGETNLISSLGSSSTVIRTAWLYGESKKTFVDQVISRISEGVNEIKIGEDQIGQLTNVNLVVRAVLNMISQGIENYDGIWNVTSREFASWYEIAVLIRDFSGSQTKLIGISSDSLNRAASRPKFSALDTSKFESMFYRLPTWQEELTNYLGQKIEIGSYRDI